MTDNARILDTMTSDTVGQQVKQAITASLPVVDSQSADRIQSLGLLHQARASRLQRNARAAATQYGAKSTQALAATAAVSAAHATTARIAVAHQQIATATPDVPTGGWVLQGRVYDSARNPLAGYTVYLVDGQKAFQSQYGYAQTDSTGYFLLSSSATAAQTAATGAKTASNATGQTDTPALYIQIANTKAKLVFLSADPFVPAVNAASYKTITLPAGERTIAELPADIRRTAQPNPKEEKPRAKP